MTDVSKDQVDHVVPPQPIERRDFVPNYDMTDDEREKLAELRSRIWDDLESDEEREHFDDACLHRYLRARDFKLDQAEKLLRETMMWRREYLKNDIHPSVVEKEFETGKCYLHGHDRYGRPVFYQKPRYQNTKDYDNQVRQVVYLIERAIESMDRSRGVEQHVLFIDFKGYSLFNAPPMSVSKQVMTVLMDRYPERLGNAFMVDAPGLFNAMWRIVRPFLPEATKQKIHFVKRRSDGSIHPKVAEFFDPEHLEEEYGGRLPSKYDHDKYFEHEYRIFEERQQRKIQVASAVSSLSSSAANDDSDDVVGRLVYV